jgi:hypothetical protein
MIAYALLRLAARRHCVNISILRFTNLIALCLFERRHLGAIEKPPPVNPRHPQCQRSHNQLSFSMPEFLRTALREQGEGGTRAAGG